MIGLGLFTAVSAAAALPSPSHGIGALVDARAVQGFMAATVTPLTLMLPPR